MADFFKPVQVQGAGRVQSAAPSGPDRDVQAHLDAQSDRGGFAGAIRDLLGVAGSVAGTVRKMNEDERLQMEKKSALKADSDVTGYGSFSKSAISKRAAEEGKSVEDYTDEEVESFIPQIKQDFIESKGLKDKDYFEIIDTRLNDRGILLARKQNQTNKIVRDNKSLNSLHVNASNNFKSMDASMYVDYLNDTMAVSVGPDAEIQKTQEEVKASLMTPLMTAAMESKDPELLKKLESKEMRDFFNVPDYDNVVNGVKQQVQSTINKRKNFNFDRVEEQGYMLAENGFLRTEQDVDNFLKNQKFKEGFTPRSKDMHKLRNALNSTVKTEGNYEAFSNAAKSGDFTFADRQGLPKKERDALGNKLFKVETGITDTSPQGITEALNSGMIDDSLKQYVMSGMPFPSDIKAWANTAPSGGVKGIKEKYVAFSQLNAMTQDAPTSITSVFKPKAYGQMMFTGQLIGKMEDGVIDEKEFQDAYSTFSNDLNKNVDSFGVYTSPNAAIFTRDDTVQGWANKASKDVDWTWDDNTSSAYTRRQLIGNFNLMIDAGMEPDEAMSKAEEMFEGSHMRFENADGTEGVMPSEFKTVMPESLTEVAANLPQLKPMKQMDELFGSEFLFRRKLSVRPARNYEQTKQVEVYYDGRPVGNTFMNREQFDSNWNKLETQESKEIRKDYEKRLEILKAEQEKEGKEGIWKWR